MIELIEPKLRLSAVTIPEMRSTFFAGNFSIEAFPKSVDRTDWTIDDDVQLVVPEDLYLWPDGEEAPEPATLCQSRNDPKHYEVFKRSSDVREDEFIRTGMAYGGTYSEWHWKRFAQELPRILNFYRILDTDPPGAEEELTHSIREAN